MGIPHLMRSIQSCLCAVEFVMLLISAALFKSTSHHSKFGQLRNVICKF